jgi:hypothetical protein
MQRSTLPLLGLMIFLVAVPSEAADPARAICDASAALTVIGVDTAAGQTLFALRSKDGERPGWVIEVDAAGERARAFPDPSTGRFGGSVGPGPVLAAVPCSGSCLQPVRWSDGAFRPLGEPLTVPQGATTAATYDATGTPWFVLLAGLASNSPRPLLKNVVTGDLRAWGWRFDGEWRDRGSQTVSAVGDLPAAPAPGSTDGIVVGTGRFRAGARPDLWAAGLPTLPPERRGQVLALSERDAAYLSSDGAAYGSTDAGASWKRSTWTPWGQGAAGPWHAGTDYWVDLPLGERRGALQLAWFDRRVPSEERLILARRDPDGSWVSLVEAPSAIRTKDGDRLTVSHVLLPREGRWLLLSGCVATKGGGSGLVLRTFDGRKLSEPRYVAIEVM